MPVMNIRSSHTACQGTVCFRTRPRPPDYLQAAPERAIQEITPRIALFVYKEKKVNALFIDFEKSVLRRWYESNCATPFLIILNDNDSASTGRRQFYELLDIFVGRGYQGSAIVRSERVQEDMNDRGNRGFVGFTFKTSSAIRKKSAVLTIEVTK